MTFGLVKILQVVKNLPAVEETQEMKVQSLAGEDPLEEEMATHSSSLGWKIQWTEEPGLYSPRGCKESATTEHIAHDNTGLTAVEDGELQERTGSYKSV